jgi:predicted branched-subunit amino acid permease
MTIFMLTPFGHHYTPRGINSSHPLAMMVPMRVPAMFRRQFPEYDHESYRLGLREMTPFGFAIGLWGFVTGVAMVNAGMTIPVALLMTLTVFAGSAQLAVVPLLALGTPLAIVWVTALLVNLRFVIFAAAQRRWFVGLPRRHRVTLGYINGDIGFALFSRRFSDSTESGDGRHWGYIMGCGLVNWTAWQASSILGIALGGLAPTDWGLELCAYLALVAVVVPMLQHFPVISGVIVASLVAVLAVELPMRLGLVVAVVAGVTVAFAGEMLQAHFRPPEAAT